MIKLNAFIECSDVNSDVEKIKSAFENYTTVCIADCTGLSSGNEIRILLNSAAKESDKSKDKLLIVRGIELIDEGQLKTGLLNFCSFIDNWLSHFRYGGDNDDSYMTYDYTFNPEGLSVIVCFQSGAQNHFVKYFHHILGGIFNPDGYMAVTERT